MNSKKAKFFALLAAYIVGYLYGYGSRERDRMRGEIGH